ncbi:hypothetical protein HDU76_002180 [Blyttiomyces sp. JEL0837]|nr:hypothetical protein HDU76_002180 [Blyttiomyces sp. JEL0837]
MSSFRRKKFNSADGLIEPAINTRAIDYLSTTLEEIFESSKKEEKPKIITCFDYNGAGRTTTIESEPAVLPSLLVSVGIWLLCLAAVRNEKCFDIVIKEGKHGDPASTGMSRREAISACRTNFRKMMAAVRDRNATKVLALNSIEDLLNQWDLIENDAANLFRKSIVSTFRGNLALVARNLAFIHVTAIATTGKDVIERWYTWDNIKLLQHVVSSSAIVPRLNGKVFVVLFALELCNSAGCKLWTLLREKADLIPLETRSSSIKFAPFAQECTDVGRIYVIHSSNNAVVVFFAQDSASGRTVRVLVQLSRGGKSEHEQVLTSFVGTALQQIDWRFFISPYTTEKAGDSEYLNQLVPERCWILSQKSDWPSIFELPIKDMCNPQQRFATRQLLRKMEEIVDAELQAAPVVGNSELLSWTAQVEEKYNRYFYVNTATGVSQWEAPVPQYAPPPGAPPQQNLYAPPPSPRPQSPAPPGQVVYQQPPQQQHQPQVVIQQAPQQQPQVVIQQAPQQQPQVVIQQAPQPQVVIQQAPTPVYVNQPPPVTVVQQPSRPSMGGISTPMAIGGGVLAGAAGVLALESIAASSHHHHHDHHHGGGSWFNPGYGGGYGGGWGGGSWGGGGWGNREEIITTSDGFGDTTTIIERQDGWGREEEIIVQQDAFGDTTTTIIEENNW